MAIAIFLKTDSCDDYLFCFDHDDIDKAISECKQSMHEEFAWALHTRVCVSGDEPQIEAEFRLRVREAVEQARGERNED